jgi:hypothetical protein
VNWRPSNFLNKNGRGPKETRKMKSQIKMQKEGTEVGCLQRKILNGKETIHLNLSFYTIQTPG